MKKTNLFASVLNSLGEFLDEASELTLNFARNTTGELGECLLGLTETAFECIDDLIETSGDAIGVTWDGEFRKEKTNHGFPVSSQIQHKIVNAPTFSEEDFIEVNTSKE